MRKWRELFAVSQISLSEKMAVFSSVISDYESGRRKSPGAKIIKKFVLSLLHLMRKKVAVLFGSLRIDQFSKHGCFRFTEFQFLSV
jgi:predicted transcriptional regulator